jgi:hypothetical protein
MVDGGSIRRRTPDADDPAASLPHESSRSSPQLSVAPRATPPAATPKLWEGSLTVRISTTGKTNKVGAARLSADDGVAVAWRGVAEHWHTEAAGWGSSLRVLIVEEQRRQAILRSLANENPGLAKIERERGQLTSRDLGAVPGALPVKLAVAPGRASEVFESSKGLWVQLVLPTLGYGAFIDAGELRELRGWIVRLPAAVHETAVTAPSAPAMASSHPTSTATGAAALSATYIARPRPVLRGPATTKGVQHPSQRTPGGAGESANTALAVQQRVAMSTEAQVEALSANLNPKTTELIKGLARKLAQRQASPTDTAAK